MEVQIGIGGTAAVTTLLAARLFRSDLVAGAAALSGVFALAVDPDQTPAALGGIGAATLISFINVGRFCDGSAVDLPMTLVTGGIGIHTLCNFYEGDPEAPVKTALFAIPAGFNLLLGYMKVHPIATTLLFPAISVAGSLWCGKELDGPPVIGGLVSSALLSVWFGLRHDMQSWIDRAAVAFLGLTAAGYGGAGGYLIIRKKTK